MIKEKLGITSKSPYRLTFQEENCPPLRKESETHWQTNEQARILRCFANTGPGPEHWRKTHLLHLNTEVFQKHTITRHFHRICGVESRFEQHLIQIITCHQRLPDHFPVFCLQRRYLPQGVLAEVPFGFAT